MTSMILQLHLHTLRSFTVIMPLTIQQIFLDCHIVRDKFPKESYKNMQKPPCEPLFSTLSYEASLYTTSLHWCHLILAFFSILFDLRTCSTAA